MTPYILWDWNGTLLDDTWAALDALNAMLARRGKPPITMGFYRNRFGFPVRPFYSAIGFEIEHEDWNAVAREYHEMYAAQPRSLNAEAFAAVEMIRRAGGRQSVISALRQDLLELDAEVFGIRDSMEFVCGTDNLDGGSKVDRARELVDRIRREHPAESFGFTLIGDSLHDVEVADALCIDCVLCSQGSHAAWRLRKAARTFPTLSEAAAFSIAPRV